MQWNQAVIPAGAPPSQPAAEVMSASCRGGETVVGAFSTHRFDYGSITGKMATVLITNRRLLVSKDRLIGSPRLDLALPLDEIVASTSGPLRGVGPTWEVSFKHERGAIGCMYFSGPDESDLVEGTLRGAVLALVNPGPSDDLLNQRVQRNAQLFAALRPLGTVGMVGEPFGEGFDLEEAIDQVDRVFSDPTELRASGQMMAITLIIGTGKYFEPEDLHAVMGATEDAFRRTDLAPAQFSAVTDLAGAASSFLGQIDDDDGPMWSLWSRRDDVAKEFLSWHSVALLRLVASGRMPESEVI